MTSPYFNTYLTTEIVLHPSQMNNDIYKHLKNNLIERFQDKCFQHYGYITKIYNIEERKGGNVIAEDPTASAKYVVKFSCRLCKPLRNSVIVCEILGINKAIIHLRNGPINVVVLESNLNSNNFIFDEKRNIFLAKDENDKIGLPILKGSYVKVKILNIQIEDKSLRILVSGSLEMLASKEEIERMILDRENDHNEFVDYDSYITKQKNDLQPSESLSEASESEENKESDSEETENSSEKE
jgi:DNA-directed RNA polymerase subunit E'/Rpb7